MFKFNNDLYNILKGEKALLQTTKNCKKKTTYNYWWDQLAVFLPVYFNRQLLDALQLLRL